jgi:peptide/nickel transport system substrate-binding protein
VRQALNYAVDKEGLIAALLEGLDVQPSQGQILTKEYFGFNPDLKPYPYDVDKAKELMDAAGVGNVDVEFDVPSGTYLLGSEIAQAIGGQLEEVGVKAKVTEMPFSVYMDKYLKQKDLAQMAYITQAWPTLDADGLLTLFESGNQYAYWDNADFSKLLDQARSTLDSNKRLDLYKQATAIMREDAPLIFLFPQPATYATSKKVQWSARPDDWVRVWDMRPAG